MVVDGTEQDVLGRYGPDSLSINQTNNQQCHHRWTEAAIGCCRTWSPPQNITIQTRVTEVTLWCAHRTWSVPLIAWELLIIDFWNLPPPPGTAFAVKVSAVSLSFVWIRASTYTEKKSPHWCVQEVWSPSSHLSDVSMRVWPAALTHSRTARAIKKRRLLFPSTGFQHFDPWAAVVLCRSDNVISEHFSGSHTPSSLLVFMAAMTAPVLQRVV